MLDCVVSENIHYPPRGGGGVMDIQWKGGSKRGEKGPKEGRGRLLEVIFRRLPVRLVGYFKKTKRLLCRASHLLSVSRCFKERIIVFIYDLLFTSA